MPRRPILPADDKAAHAAWIAEAVVARFQFPRKLPSLRVPFKWVAHDPLPDLFRDLLDAKAASDKPVAPAPAQSDLTDVDGPPADKPTPVGKRRESRLQREAEAAEKARRNRELPPLDPGVVMREPELADQVEVKEALYEVVPRGVPHWQKATLAVHRSRDRIIADVRLFDDEIGRVEITGSKGGRGYRWHHSGVAGTAFHWNEGARCWERILDPSELT